VTSREAKLTALWEKLEESDDLPLFGRIFEAAAITFGKTAGSSESLTPFSRTWRTVNRRAEHAIWMWNEKYGPLSPAQVEYVGDLIVHALKHAASAPSDGQKYAYFHTQLTSLLNHERVDAGFDQRAERGDLAASLAAALEDSYQMEAMA